MVLPCYTSLLCFLLRSSRRLCNQSCTFHQCLGILQARDGQFLVLDSSPHHTKIVSFCCFFHPKERDKVAFLLFKVTPGGLNSQHLLLSHASHLKNDTALRNFLRGHDLNRPTRKKYQFLLLEVSVGIELAQSAEDHFNIAKPWWFGFKNKTWLDTLKH